MTNDNPLEGRVREHWAAYLAGNKSWRHVAGSDLEEVIEHLDQGTLRAASPSLGAEWGWHVHEWVKQAIILYFLANAPSVIEGAAGDNRYDIVPPKFQGWWSEHFGRAGFRAARGSDVRKGAFIGKRAVLMPSCFVNIGARVGEGTMVDTGARVGSCAQIGERVHLSGGVGIGGVLEPAQDRPTIIEDDCFIGANSEIAEGVVVRHGAVIAPVTFIGANTPIVNDLNGGEIIRGHVPTSVVVMSGVHPNGKLICPHIVKLRDSNTDAKVALNEALRESC